MRAEQVTAPVAYHGEGPVWSEHWGGLRWVDMLAGDILSLASDVQTLYIDPGCPWQNGKDERFNGTVRDESEYAALRLC